MAKTKLGWVVSQVTTWREEAGIEKKIDDDLLDKAVARVREAGVSEDWVVFTILACEWLFRQKRMGHEEIDQALAKIQAALRGGMHELAWFVTEALKPRVSELLKKEGRMLPALGLHWRESPVLPAKRGQRVPSRPQKLAPPRRGRPPWPASWIAGIVVDKTLGKEGKVELAVDLVSALLGNRIVDPRDFRRTRTRLDCPELSSFIDQLTESFKHHVERSPAGPRMSKKKLEVVGPRNLFPTDPRIATKLFDAYSGRRP